MDFTQRAEWEARLAQRLGKLGERQRREIMRLLGDPPRLTNIGIDYWEQYKNELQSVLGPDLEAIYLQSAANFLGEQPAFGVDWTMVNRRAVQWGKDYNYRWVTQMTDNAREGLQELIPQFFERQMNLGELRQHLGQWFGPIRADMIATTETTRAAVEGEEAIAAELRAQGIDMVEVWQTNNDEIVANCPICAPRQGKAKGDGWDKPPPAHPRCILPGNEVVTFGPLVAAAKSFYIGRCVEITLSNGRVVTVTENHPILTPQGWIAAQFLSQGDDVFYAATPERIAARIEPHDDHRPAAIEQVFDTLMESGAVSTRRVPAAAEDFHGDGRGISRHDGNIEIVGADGFLLDNIETRLTELRRKLSLSGYDTGLLRLVAHNVFNRLGKVCCDAPPGSPAIDTGLASKFILRFASDVMLQQVAKIRYFHTSTHVYDLQSDLFQLFACNGVIVSNCRCWVTHELPKSQAEIAAEAQAATTGKPWTQAAGTVLDEPQTSAAALQDWMTKGLPLDREYAAGAAKNELVTELSKRSGVDYKRVNDLIAQWAQSSNDNDMRSLAIQEDMAKILGIDLPKWQADKLAALRADLPKLISQGFNRDDLLNFYPLMDSESQQKILQAMYDYTQERLDAAGIGDTVRLYRGMSVDKSIVDEWMKNAGMTDNYNLLNTENVKYRGSVLESWSSNPNVAQGFSHDYDPNEAGVVFQMDIPRARLMGSARSGFGCLDEWEFVHLGAFNDEVARISKIHTRGG